MVDMNTSNTTKFAIAIELSNPNASADAHAVGLFLVGADKSELVDSLPVPSTVRSADALMMLIETLCTKHKIAPGDIDRIVVSVGPGGYTALRISSTTAKVLAHTIGCALVAVPSAVVASEAVKPEHRPALIALASKNNQSHCSILAADGSLKAVGVIDASKIESLQVRTIIADAHLPELFIDKAKELGIEIVPIELDARNVLEAAKGIKPIDPIELAPIYAREPDAITQWRARAKK